MHRVMSYSGTRREERLRTMQEIIDWLRHMEQLACELYRAISAYFSEDEELSSFLSKLAEEESFHAQLMGSAAQHLQEAKERPSSAVRLDSTTRDRLETPLKRLQSLMMDRAISKQDVLDSIVKIEFSEWNDIFLYVIDALKKYSKTFQQGAAAIQAHQRRIERFLEDLPADLSANSDIRKLPRIWKEKILIVEDEPPIRDILARFLGHLGSVETASNGKAALDKTKDHFFDAVVSDMEMPFMGGLEFYHEATRMDPEMGHRFLFCTGKITPEIANFCREHDIVCLEKPFRLHQLGEAVRTIINKTF